MTVEFYEPIVVLGGAKVSQKHLERYLGSGAILVCVDGGAQTALDFGLTPDLIVGDMDSFKSPFEGRVLKLDEQDTTDFEKCLYSVTAPAMIALGFTGGRLDHELSVFNVLAKYRDHSVVVVSDEDAIFRCPDRLELELEIGARVSVFPMSRVQMRSVGLEWPLDGLVLTPNGQVGTSNRAVQAKIGLNVDAGDVLGLVPLRYLDVVIAALIR